jgi:hypothetical protein
MKRRSFQVTNGSKVLQLNGEYQMCQEVWRSKMPKVGFGGAEDIGRTLPDPWDRIVPLGSANRMQHDTAMFCTSDVPMLEQTQKGENW